MFFNEEVMFRLDEMVAEQPTFKKIMEDGIITDAEIEAQSNLVLDLYKKLETTFTPEQLKLIGDTMIETAVLQAAYQYKELQELHF